MTASALTTAFDSYIAARGIPAPRVTNCVKPLEEAAELFAAWNAEPRQLHAVMAEVADVVLSVCTVARQLGVTVEECIAYKVALDAGRGPKIGADQ